VLLPPTRAFVETCALAPGPGWLERFEALRGLSHPWLLDSSLPSPGLGRFSFAGADPWAVLRVRGERCELLVLRAVRPGLPAGRRELRGDPFELLRALAPPRPALAHEGLPPFAGGIVGTFGYELAARTLGVELFAEDDLGLPDATLLFVDRLLAHDHASGRSLALGLGFGASDEAARANGRRAAFEHARASETPRARAAPAERRASRPCVDGLDESRHGKASERVLEEIAAGNVYQACLTRRIERETSADPWALHRALRRRNPAPFACFFELPEAAIIGSSPERFLRVDADGRVESRPIKGTRPRGADPVSDARERSALLASEKDRAENLMIVDLVRNDLGRVCATGSVCVPELMAVEDYASVFQLVSTVRGRLRPECGALDALHALFPPGSMTGAPKIAAVRLLDRLEPVRRGIYSGAIGYLDARGGADLCVAIRTLVLAGGRAWVHTGGGIVADSDPGGEWQETLVKAQPLLEALDELARPARAGS
jgi:aminodeoxychorismate synthase component I